MVGDGGRFIPAGVPVRSVVGVKGFSKQGTGRVQIGGDFGANVPEKIVNVTLTADRDERDVFWSQDQLTLYFAGNRSSDRYNLYRSAADAPANPIVGGLGVAAITQDTGNFDYRFPALDNAGARIAFLRSSDTLPIGDANKKYNLYVSNLPFGDNLNGNVETGEFIDEQIGGVTNLIPITTQSDGTPLIFPSNDTGKAIVNVGRAAWVGPDTLVFTAQLEGRTDYDVFQVSVSTRQLIQLTDSPADEQNVAVSTNGLTIAFDSDAMFATDDAAPETYTAGTGRSNVSPNAVPPTAPANGIGQRQVFQMPISVPTLQPTQVTGRFADAATYDPAISNREPSFGVSGIAFSSDRKAIIDPTDPTGTVITRYDRTTDGAGDLYIISGVENAFGAALRFDTVDPEAKFDDRYPYWSPATPAQKLGYVSNRTGTYNKDGFGLGFGEPLPVNDVFVGTVIDITAPLLIRYDTTTSSGDIIHINPGTTYDATTRVRTREDGVLPGSDMFFTVRVEDREAGMHQPAAPGETPKAVFLQFKNPNSKYQSIAQGGAGVEHKEFFFNPNAGVLAFAFAEANAAGQPVPVSLQGSATQNMGVEFECNAIGTDGVTYFAHPGSTMTPFAQVLYIPSGNDFDAFAGGSNPPLDGTNGQPAVWLELLPLLNEDGTPKRPADGKGGILYGATWKLPNEASDWYVDVILYDNAVNPFDTSQKSNFIIYDNVWGFSSALPLTPLATDILVVADYLLGQKFFATRLGNSNAGNLQPIIFGTESYLTDIDMARFPTGVAPSAPGSTTVRFWDTRGPFRHDTASSPVQAAGNFAASPPLPAQGIYPNTLGVNSYSDEFIASGGGTTTVDGKVLPMTGRYSIWRILSRGAVPSGLLQTYLPQKVVAPPDLAAGETQPRTVLHASRMIVWSSPFLGNVFSGPGTLGDLGTQNELTDFVNNGGRLFVTGQDVGFALAGNNQANSFYSDILGARFVSDDAGGPRSIVPEPIAAAPLPYNGQTRQDAWDPRAAGTPQHAYGRTTGTTWDYTGMNATPTFFVSNALPIDQMRGDGSFVGRALASFQDRVAPNGSTVEFAYNNITTTPPEGPLLTKSFAGGGRTTYAAFTFESLSNEWYVFTPNGAMNPVIATLGRRAGIMHNISDSSRTGTFSGKLVDDNGSPVTDALVRIEPTGSTAQPVGTALTDNGGNYIAQGIVPGAYQVSGFKAGYYTQHSTGHVVHGGWKTTVNFALKRANPGTLTGIRQSSTNQGGIFRADGVTPLGNVEVRVTRIGASGSTTVRTISSDGNDSNNGAQAADPRFNGAIISTGPLGAYQFPTLPIDPFGYIVVANPSDSPAVVDVLDKDVRLGVPPQTKTRIGPGTTVIDINTDPAIDDPRLVIAENFNSQVDFLLGSGPQAVSGFVRIDDNDPATPGNPLPNATVTIENATGTVLDTETSATDGSYTFKDSAGVNILFPEGTYTIKAQAPGYASTNPPSERPTTTVTVGGASSVIVAAADLELEKLPPGSVSGLVTRIPNNTVQDGATVTLYSVVNGVRAEAATATTQTTMLQTATDGYRFNYKFDGVGDGDYVATVSFTGFVGRPVQSAVFHVTTQQETRNINFTLEPPKIYGAGLQLVSTPFDYSDVAPYTIFDIKTTDTSFASFNVADWTGTEYKVGKDINLVSGKGYFVRFGAESAVAFTGKAITNDIVPITLNKEWNLIGNPFSDKTNPSAPAANLDLTRDAEIVDQSGNVYTMEQAINAGLVRGVVFGYTGSGSNSQYFQATVLQTWQGYWFRNTARDANGNLVPITLRLKRPPTTTGKAVKLASRKAIFREDQEKPVMRSIASTGFDNWRLQLAARQGDLMDTDNSIGIAPGAKDGYDNKFDTEKPPMMTQAAQVYVAINGANEVGRAAPLSDNIRASGKDSKSWEFSVQASGDGEVTVFWPNANRLPRGLEPMLTDLETGRRVPMRTGASSYRFMPSGKTASRKFRVDVAKPLSVPLAVTNVKQTRLIGRGPNSGYRFSFTVTREADVQAVVQTLTGKTVQRIVTRAQSATESFVTWDGRSQEGATLPAGPYVLTLTAKDSNGSTAQVRLPLMVLR